MINKPKNILLVGNDPDINHVIVNIFENTKWTFFQARNVDQAYDIVCHEHVDMLINDCNVPACNGLTLIQRLKENPQTFHVPIMILTGIMADNEHIKKAFELGAVDFMRKPINKVELNARVVSVLNLFDAHKQQIAGSAAISRGKKPNFTKRIGLLEKNDV
ncbi:MAG: response regulator [Bacteroidales bacterium]|nr:response regulator [Bacteroidales bacterium]